MQDLAILAVGAFAIRLAWVAVFGRVGAPDGGVNDTTFYQFAAASLATDWRYMGLEMVPTAGWPPGFPFVMSLLYRVFGLHLKMALGLNVLLSTATVVFMYLVAERMFSRRAALVAASFFAILPGPLFFTGLYMSETMFIFLLLGFLALALFLPDRRWTPVVLGVAIGLTALTRGEGMLMWIIPLAIWWGQYPRGAWARRAAVLVLAMLLTIAPWTVRNALVMDAFIPVSNNASSTLWWGHNSAANGGRFIGKEPPLPKSGRRDETSRAKLLRREARAWALRNPHKELALIPKKLVALQGSSSGAISGWINSGSKSQRQLGLSSALFFGVLADALGYFLLLATLASLALLGTRTLWRTHPGMQGVLAYLALCLVNYGFLYYGQYRYRIPMEPFMMLVASPLLVALWDQRLRLRDGIATRNGQRNPDADQLRREPTGRFKPTSTAKSRAPIVQAQDD